MSDVDLVGQLLQEEGQPHDVHPASESMILQEELRAGENSVGSHQQPKEPSEVVNFLLHLYIFFRK